MAVARLRVLKDGERESRRVGGGFGFSEEGRSRWRSEMSEGSEWT